MSEANKANRNKQDDLHRTGRTSHAVIRAKKLSKKERADRVGMYFATHFDPTGNTSDARAVARREQINQKIAAYPEDVREIDEVREAVYREVFGPDRHGRVRALGTGVSPTQVFGSYSQTARQREEQARQEWQKKMEAYWEGKMNEALANQKKDFESRFDDIKREIAQMQSQMATPFTLTPSEDDPSHRSSHAQSSRQPQHRTPSPPPSQSQPVAQTGSDTPSPDPPLSQAQPSVSVLPSSSLKKRRQ